MSRYNPETLCKTCLYRDEQSKQGVCRRHSPSWHPACIEGGDQPGWPVTDPEDWCGDYRSMSAPVVK